ncbi:C6 zinc finger domain-containing protein [Colletotrichum camelliae]|nr:C6 zinc finger domain-containing protein [Colletotrichum camelliae]
MIPPAPTIEIWGRGLELMHHYTLSTGNSLAIRPDMQYVWRVNLPEIGYACPFVMHGILTISALHKAYLIPPERETYLDLATAHQNAGLEGFRAELHNINDTNWQTFFSFASIVVMYVSSVPVRLGSETEAIPNILELFVFVRGIRAVLEPFQGRLVKTKFAALVHGIWTIDPDDVNYRHPQMHLSPLPPDIFQAFTELATFFRESLSEDCRDEYLKAVEELEKAIYFMAHAGTNVEVGMIMFWPYVISENIMTDIQGQNPFSMVLLSYFAIPLCVLEQRYWFLQGWSRRLIEVSDIVLAEHPALLEMVKWPRRQVFELYGPI